MNDSKTHRGRCLCGAVTYEIQAFPKIVAHCHCVDCQRLSGSGHTTGAMFSTETLKLKGKTAEYNLQANNKTVVTRVFCPACGSPILGKNTGMPGFVTITLGTLEDSSDFTPEVTIFSRNCNKWDIMDTTLLSFDTQPDWKPDR